MIDAKILKNDINRINDMLQKRNIKFPLEELIEEDTKRRKLLTKLQDERHKKNNIAKIIATKKRMIKQSSLRSN